MVSQKSPTTGLLLCSAHPQGRVRTPSSPSDKTVTPAALCCPSLCLCVPVDLSKDDGSPRPSVSCHLQAGWLRFTHLNRRRRRPALAPAQHDSQDDDDGSHPHAAHQQLPSWPPRPLLLLGLPLGLKALPSFRCFPLFLLLLLRPHLPKSARKEGTHEGIAWGDPLPVGLDQSWVGCTETVG